MVYLNLNSVSNDKLTNKNLFFVGLGPMATSIIAIIVFWNLTLDVNIFSFSFVHRLDIFYVPVNNLKELRLLMTVEWPENFLCFIPVRDEEVEVSYSATMSIVLVQYLIIFKYEN